MDCDDYRKRTKLQHECVVVCVRREKCFFFVSHHHHVRKPQKLAARRLTSTPTGKKGKTSMKGDERAGRNPPVSHQALSSLYVCLHRWVIGESDDGSFAHTRHSKNKFPRSSTSAGGYDMSAFFGWLCRWHYSTCVSNIDVTNERGVDGGPHN